jgi:hypothetical protein
MNAKRRKRKKKGAAVVVAAAASALSLMVVTIVLAVMMVVCCGYKPTHTSAKEKKRRRLEREQYFLSYSLRNFLLYYAQYTSEKKTNADAPFLSITVASNISLASYDILVWTSDDLGILTS